MPNYGSINKLASITSSDIQVSDNNGIYTFVGPDQVMLFILLTECVAINPTAICPSVAIGSMQIYMCGVPAKYGDFTGG